MAQAPRTAKLSSRGRVTIPKEIREILHLEPGDLFLIQVEKGRIVLVPKARRDPEQAWFWSEEWQKGEQEADRDIRAGRVFGPFSSVEEMKEHFQALRDELVECEED